MPNSRKRRQQMSLVNDWHEQAIKELAQCMHDMEYWFRSTGGSYAGVARERLRASYEELERAWKEVEAELARSVDRGPVPGSVEPREPVRAAPEDAGLGEIAEVPGK